MHPTFSSAQGGVWWGDDGTLNDAVSKGNIADDPLFREAEKMGIDIRKKRQDEMPSESQVCRSKIRRRVVLVDVDIYI